MKSICLFSSYSELPAISYYVRVYLLELKNHFSPVVLITNNRTLNNESTEWLKKENIDLILVENKGYDFGMWHKAMINIDLFQYDTVALVNDSCILFKPLNNFINWVKNSDLEYCGIVDSSEYNYHIQSFLIIIKAPAYRLIKEYFDKTGDQTSHNDIVTKYEMGLCQHLINSGIKIGAQYTGEKYVSGINPSVYAVSKMIKDGLPLIKKKILFSSFTEKEYSDTLRKKFNHNPEYYVSMIKKNSIDNLLLDFKLLEHDDYKGNTINTYISNIKASFVRRASAIKAFIINTRWYLSQSIRSLIKSDK
jgi:lipopolysaccharide biosynthesis protein